MARILIISEVKQRELLSNIALSYLLKELGHEVEVISSYMFPSFKIDKFKPNVIINNGMRINRDYYRFIKYPKIKYNAKIITVYAEQILADAVTDGFYRHDGILKDTDAHITWGESFAEKLLNNKIIDKNKVYIIGSHRLDTPVLIKNSVKKESIAKKYNLDVNKKWIMIAANIIIIKGRDSKEYIMYKQESRQKFIDGIKRMAEELKDVEIIYRFHPATSKEQKKEEAEQFRDYVNIHFINEESVSYWLSQIDMMVIWQSTSSIEAWAANVPVISYIPVDTPKEFDTWHMNFVTKTDNIQVIIENVKKCIKNGILEEDKKILELRKEFIHKWYYKIDGKSTYRLAYVIDKISKDRIEPYTSKESKINLLLYKIIWKMIEVYKGINTIVFRKNSHIFYKKDIESNKAIIDSIENYKIESYKKYTFKLGSKGWTIDL